jgi:prepilin-type N-terminal cleavage/methylation domain-containing protein
MKTKRSQSAGFTLLELMTVLAVIVVLTGMVVGVAGMVQTKAAKERAKAEMAMLSAAAEAYKADVGAYPQTERTDNLSPRKDFTPTNSKYLDASLDLYRELSGDREEPYPNGVPDTDAQRYLKEYDPRILKTSTSNGKKEVKYLQDPFGFAYGYSTAALKAEREYQKALRTDRTTPRPTGDALGGFNTSSFDLWSTAASNPTKGVTGQKEMEAEQGKWLKNW